MLSSIILFFQQIWYKRRLIVMMSRREIIGQYVGSGLGPFWMIIHPIIMITVYWFVFSIGFKVKPTNDVPFVVWLTAGLAPWFLFSNIISGSTAVVAEHSHLIKKTIFSPQVLPLIKICAALITHLIFITILIALILFQHMAVLVWFLQIVYYLICLVVLALGMSWLFSALFVFVRDVGQIVSVLLQIGFWVTPIFWDISLMKDHPLVQKILKLNPVYYIIQGYRDSFIYGIPFWDRPVYFLYFWCCAGVIVAVGTLVFIRLKSQFSDVL
jgi:lipopolysaccharide transport system permease protein/teichoic acid transport system permease protein